MKKLMVAIAGAVAIGCSAFAAEPKTWFDGGIAENWPTAATLSGGAWSNTVQGTYGNGKVVIDADAATPLTFTATNAKTVTKMPQEAGEAEEVVFNATIKFTPFESLPAVPEGAKAGVIVSKDEGQGPYYYYIDNGNWMKYSEDSEPKADSAVEVSITVNGFDGKISYVIDGGELYEVDMDEAQTYSTVNFTGDGEVSALSADYTSDISEFTVADIAGATKVVNVNGEDVEEPYWGRENDNLVVTYTAAQGKLFKNGTNKYVYSGKVGEGGAIDTKVSEQGLKDAPAKILNTLYYTLADAFKDVADGQTLTLLTAVDESIDYKEDQAFTLDMNGKAWAVTGGATALKVDAKDADITITGNGSITVAKGFCVWARQGAVTIENGTFTNDDNDNYAIYAGGGKGTQEEPYLASKVTIKDGTFVNLNADPYKYNPLLSKLNLNVQNGNTLAVIEVSGGTYTAEPKDDTGINFVKDGYVAKKDGEIWTVVEAKAKAGTTYYLTLKEAFDAVKAGETVTLLAAADESIVYEGAAKFTLDLNGKAWAVTGGATALKVDNAGADITITGNGSITVAQGFCVWARQGAVTIKNGTFTNDDNDNYAVYAGGGKGTQEEPYLASKVTIEDGTFVNLNADPYKYNPLLSKLNLNVQNGNALAVIEVSGGTYTAEPKDDTGINFVKDGYATKKVGEVWTVGEAKAKIGTTYYLTLKDAFDALKDGDTITLTADSEGVDTLTCTEANITLDLNGFTYGHLSTASGYVLSAEGGKLTITDSSTDADGKLVKYGIATVVQVKSGAELVFEKGQLVFDGDNEGTSNSGSVIAVKSNSSCTMNGGKVIVKNKYQQVALRSDNTFVVNGGYVDGGFKVTNPGTISLKGGEYTEDPTAYVASGYEATYDDTTELWTIAEKPAVPGWIDPDDTTNVALYNAWAENYGVTNPADAKEDAFLFNVNNTDEAIEEAEEEFTLEITFDDDGNPVVECPNEDSYNGTVVLWGKAALTDDAWHAKTTGDQFFKATLELIPGN